MMLYYGKIIFWFGRRALIPSLVEEQKIEKIDKTATLSKGINRKISFQQIIAYVPGKILTAFVGLESTSIISRAFSADEFGQYSLVLSVTMFVEALSSQWFQQATNRYLSGGTNVTRQTVKQVFSLGLILILVILDIVSVILILSVNLLMPQWKGFILSGVLLIMTTSVFNPIGVILQAEMRAYMFSRYSLANAVAKLLLSMFVVFGSAQSLNDMV